MFQKLWPFSNPSQSSGGPNLNEQRDHGVTTRVKPVYASFNKGIPLNMKIIIRGDIRTGKTSFFERLQGLPFRNEREYRTTKQIQVANIPWQYPHTKDIIKVEVWDVVDKGIQSGDLKASGGSSLKIDNNTPSSPTKAKSAQDTEVAPHAAFALDASTIDVYRNTDGVILLYDNSKPWTIDYAARTLADIPTNIPVLFLRNFSDDSHIKTIVPSEVVEALMNEYNAIRRRHPCSPANLIRHLNTSMKTGLGLKEIRENFGILFLNVLRETHRKQFEQKTQEINNLLKKLDESSQQLYTRSIQPQYHQQQQQQQQQPTTANVIPAQPLSPKDAAVSKRALKLFTPIQTTGPAIHPIPQTSSPTSPARKTRNDHTNVDILSPTPVSVQTPAVLFDFNSGKLEEEFFQNIDLDSSEPAVSDNGKIWTSTTRAMSTRYETVDGNPMVTGDEDIDDSASDSLVGSNHHSLALETVWTPGQAVGELLTDHGVKGSEETFLEEVQDDGMATSGYSENGLEPREDSISSIGSTPPLRHLTRQDSDNDSQQEFPVASAMYYVHDPSMFAQGGKYTHHLDGKAVNSAILSEYEEIAGGHNHNPWKSTGDLLDHDFNKGSEHQKAHLEPIGEGSLDMSSLTTAQLEGVGDDDTHMKPVGTKIAPNAAIAASTDNMNIRSEINKSNSKEEPITASVSVGKKTKKKGKKSKKGVK